MALIVFIGTNQKTNAQQVNVADITRYQHFTYNPSNPHVNPFKLNGTAGMTWDQHMQNVQANTMTYMGSPVNTELKYMNEAAYCLNFNRAAMGYSVDFIGANAEFFFVSGKEVTLYDFPAGRLFVLGRLVSGTGLGGFLNPHYDSITLVEATSSKNGAKVYISKHCGSGKECCINLVIDLYPRTQRGEIQYIHDTLIIDHTTIIHDRDVYNTNVYPRETFYARSGPDWFPIPLPQIQFCQPGYYMMPMTACMPIFRCQPPYYSRYRGQEYAMVPKTPANVTIFNNYLSVHHVTNVTNNKTTIVNVTQQLPVVVVVVVHPEVPRPADVPLYNNTGGAGDGLNETAGGGDVPGGDTSTSTGGGGTGYDNTGGVGKKEVDAQGRVWTETDPRGQVTRERQSEVARNDQYLVNKPNTSSSYFDQPLASSVSNYNQQQQYDPSYNAGQNFQGTGIIGNASNNNFGIPNDFYGYNQNYNNQNQNFQNAQQPRQQSNSAAAQPRQTYSQVNTYVNTAPRGGTTTTPTQPARSTGRVPN